MQASKRHHYLVRTHYSQDTRGLKCFETSNGAIAYIVAQSSNRGVTCTAECLPRGECAVCNPYVSAS